MAEVSEDDLVKQRAKVESLRDKVAESASAREEREQAVSREIEMAQLQAEEARLQGQISLNKEAAKVSTVRAGTAELLETVRDDGPSPAAGNDADTSAAKE